MADARRGAQPPVTNPMRQALRVFLATTAVGLLIIGWVAHTAWRYGDRATGRARGGA